MYWPAGPGGVGMCRKFRNPLSPKTRKIRPNRMRAIKTAIFMAFSLNRDASNLLEVGLQEEAAIDRP